MKPSKHQMLDKQHDIVFIHHKKKEVVSMSYGKNPLNGQTMWWYSFLTGMWSGTKADVNNVISDIKNKCEVISETIQ